MRHLLVIFCLFSLSLNVEAQSDNYKRGDASRSLQADDSVLFDRQLQDDSKSRGSDLRNLSFAKFALMAGNTSLAQSYLDRLGSDHPRLKQIIQRYSALSAFMQDDYGKTYDLLKSERLNIINSYEEICLLRLVSLFALGKEHPEYSKISPEFDSCRAITYKYTDNDHFWLTSMKKIVQGKIRSLPGANVNDFTSILVTDDTTKLWMKLALYTNREKQIIKNIGLLPEESYLNVGIRELLGMAYYRMGDIKNSQDFIEDISTPNADNIRGDIALSKKEWELAYGHFRLALKRKDDSLNALERAIPLTWL